MEELTKKYTNSILTVVLFPKINHSLEILNGKF